MRTPIFLLILSLAASACAQSNATAKVTITSPLDYQVFQRQTRAGGRIVLDTLVEAPGHAALTNLDKLEVRLTGKPGTSQLSGDWQPLPFDNRVRRFRAELAAPAGGWYRLEVRLGGKGRIVSEVAVEHVGVGEVFVIAGQSNSANHGQEPQQPKSPLVVAFGNGRWRPANDPQPGASGKGGSFLPAFGDAMAARFKMPIGFVAIGVGSTSVREWLPKGEIIAAPPTTGANTVFFGSNSWTSTGALFDRILGAQQMSGTNGFRALLWHQGESDVHQAPDREITPAQYRQYLQRVIEAARAAAGWRVPWFVAQVSYHTPDDPGSAELRAAQKSLVTDGVALAGPNTDELGPEFRDRNGHGVHFSARGLQRHGELWAEHVAPWLQRQLGTDSPNQ